jgi:hypothetical protein
MEINMAAKISKGISMYPHAPWRIGVETLERLHAYLRWSARNIFNRMAEMDDPSSQTSFLRTYMNNGPYFIDKPRPPQAIRGSGIGNLKNDPRWPAYKNVLQRWTDDTQAGRSLLRNIATHAHQISFCSLLCMNALATRERLLRTLQRNVAPPSDAIFDAAEAVFGWIVTKYKDLETYAKHAQTKRSGDADLYSIKLPAWRADPLYTTFLTSALSRRFSNLSEPQQREHILMVSASNAYL